MIHCERIIFFDDSERKMVAIHIKCSLFERTFYYDNDVENAWGFMYDTELGKQEVGMELKDGSKYKFTVDEEEWIHLKTYKDQISEKLV